MKKKERLNKIQLYKGYLLIKMFIILHFIFSNLKEKHSLNISSKFIIFSKLKFDISNLDNEEHP